MSRPHQCLSPVSVTGYGGHPRQYNFEITNLCRHTAPGELCFLTTHILCLNSDRFSPNKWFKEMHTSGEVVISQPKDLDFTLHAQDFLVTSASFHSPKLS